MKMISIKTLTLMSALAILGFGFWLPADTQAQTRRRSVPVRVSDRQSEQILRSLEQRSSTFRRSFDAALDHSRLDGTYTEDSVNEYVKNFEAATNDLRVRFDRRTAAGADVDNVLNRAALIDRFMQTNLRQKTRAQGDWALLKGDLQRLANAYNVAFNLNGRVLPPSVLATQQPYRVSDSQVQALLNRIDTKSKTYRRTLDSALDRSRFNSTTREDNINEFVKDFEDSTDRLRKNFDGRTSVGNDAANVLVRAARIDDFMKRNLRRDTAVQRDWNALRADLNQLSNYYSLSYNLDNRTGLPAYQPVGVLINSDALLTGTYRLNVSQSDNARTVAGRVTQNLSDNRDRIFNNLVNRLDAPDALAVERQGMRVRLASSRSPEVTLDVDNIEHPETYPNGRASTVRTSFNGDTLSVVSNGDRANDFTATFSPMDGGRRLLVTRSVYAEQLGQPVEVKSYYDRTADAAQFNIYSNSNTPVYTGSNSGVSSSFYIPNDTILTAALNNNISTKTARDGDRFTMTVRSPAQYAGATIEGYVSNANRSGKITGRSELSLNYQTIRLANNQSYRFAGFTGSVRTTSGETLQVDNEGTVKDDDQTTKTVTRTAIGTGIGALLGAIIGGGKGAAIGAGVGAGTGAGSVYVQGRDDLELMNGSEFTIRATAPRNY